jgi:hypothetical protein
MGAKFSEAKIVVLARGVILPPRIRPDIMIINQLQTRSATLHCSDLIKSLTRQWKEKII